MTVLFTFLAMIAAAPPAKPHPAPSIRGAAVAEQLTAEQAVRAFMYALYANDADEYSRRIVPEPGANALIGRQRFSTEELRQLRSEVDAMELSRDAPFTHEGRVLSGASESSLPEGAKTVFTGDFRGTPLVIPVVRAGGEWKVDVRFWLAMSRQQESEPDESAPEMRAKEFLFYILSKQPGKLGGVSATKVDGEAFTRANNLPAGDMDQVVSLCVEMPVVRARAGEAFRLPSGEIVRGGAQGDSLVLVGLMGTTEIPFVLVKKQGKWMVVPQHYFEMLRAARAI